MNDRWFAALASTAAFGCIAAATMVDGWQRVTFAACAGVWAFILISEIIYATKEPHD